MKVMYVNSVKLAFLLIVWFWNSNVLISQSVYTHATKAIKGLKQEVNDSIIAFRHKSDILREEILRLIKEKNFDEKLIIGHDRKYFNEGMSQQFRTNLHKPNIPSGRDSKVVALEKAHFDLFYIDLKLAIAKKMLFELQSLDILKFIDSLNSDLLT